MEVSVIIPVYNAEKTIEETIQSIKSKYAHEIICINDGSADNSADVISNIDNPNIVLVNNENQGAAATRNEGIRIAKGKYIMFCDADDKLGADVIDQMVDTIKLHNTDIVVGKVAHLIGDEVRTIQTYNDLKPVERTTLNRTPEVIQSIGPYGKLYKREILSDIKFDEGITFCEEHTFNLKAWAKSKITVIDHVSYLYNIGVEDSIIATSYKNIEKYLNDATEVRKQSLIILNELKEKVGNYYSYRMDYLIIYFLIRNNFMKVEDIDQLLNAAISYFEVIEHIDTKHVKELKSLILTIATTKNYQSYVQVATQINENTDKKTFRHYKMKRIKLITKMNLRSVRNKSKKISH
ncbi:glycosyltransferase family 2 protein [Mammaliicoccus sp. Dog046]|uniref:glycosyltransferase family 2 protein n=1 Tax=Mammaliicoccus sp. Dog046 TaxID=3034233 RepID=UPI002B25CAC3|nr:glycosyltransferase family 2 protein [Mammaliicoccus sp. Dog046]WQK84767.1 glycosyltransferase family 2 protein [Mammaliicoccus sp. Dog046]